MNSNQSTRLQLRVISANEKPRRKSSEIIYNVSFIWPQSIFFINKNFILKFSQIALREMCSTIDYDIVIIELYLQSFDGQMSFNAC